MSRNFKHRPLFASNLPKEVSKPKVKWAVLPVLWLAMKRTAMVVGFFVLFNIVLSLLLLPVVFKGAAPMLPDEMVLRLDFDGGIAELPQEAGFADPFSPPALTVRELVEALDFAADDERVKGLVAQMKGGGISLAHAHEIRGALARFRAAGKFAHIYSMSYGEAGGGISRYYLASGFDEIWMQPLGIVTIMGVNAELPFFRDALDKIGVSPQFYKRKDYKTAYESFTHSGISPESRETYSRMIADIRAEILDVVPAARGIERWAFGKMVDKGLFTGEEALKAGLITHLDYEDVLLDRVKEAVGGDGGVSSDGVFVDFEDYADGVPKVRGRDRVAVVYVAGVIVESADGGGVPGSGGQVAAADEIAPALMAAADDADVKAVILRVDSPGGSPSASETILRGVLKVQEAGKLVIVSMGPTAASGGYWVASSADEIFVLPATLTGSIGVLGGKVALGALWDKVGVNWDAVRWGKNAGMWSSNTPFSAGEAERINAMLDRVYEAFVARVSEGREMSVAEVEAVAGGRVWTGRRAVENGLADQIGGLREALDYIAVELGHESREDIGVVIMPKPKSALEQFLALMEGQASLGRFVRSYSGLFEVFEPLAEIAARVKSPRDFVAYEDVRFK